jgi:hypothetical protein
MYSVHSNSLDFEWSICVLKRNGPEIECQSKIGQIGPGFQVVKLFLTIQKNQTKNKMVKLVQAILYERKIFLNRLLYKTVQAAEIGC